LSKVSFLFTARSPGYLLGSLVGGRLYDQVLGHIIMAVIFVVMAVMLTLAPVIPFLWLLTAALLVGMGEGAVDVGGNTLLVWVHRHDVGPFMNGLHFFRRRRFSPIIAGAQRESHQTDLISEIWYLRAGCQQHIAGNDARGQCPHAVPYDSSAGEWRGNDLEALHF